MKKPIDLAAVTSLLLAVCCAPCWAQFVQNKLTYETFDWQVYKSPHFDVHYYPAMEPFLEEIVSYAESAYLEISRDLDHELRFRVPLITYKTHGEFQQTNVTLYELPEGVAAFAEPIQNRMVLPIDLPPDKLQQLIAHELVHIFQYDLFFEGYLGRALRSSLPTWLMEGMASYLAHDEDNLDRMAIRDAVVNNILPGIDELNVLSFLTYRYGHAIFDYIEQEHGKEGLRNFVFEYRKVLLTGNIEKAIKEAFGYDLEAFDRRFNRYLRKKYFPVLLEKKFPDDYGKEIGLKKPGVPTFSPTVSPSGELVAALSWKLELDLLVLSADDGSKVKNLTAGWTNSYHQLVAAAFEAKRDLSWSPVADHIAVFARKENRWPLLIFDALSGHRREEVVFEDVVECASPAFSPDGRRVAFEGNRNGVVDIFEVDLETRTLRNLTQDDFFDANPWYAADGKTLLYNRRIGSYWKIFSVDIVDSAKKTQLTFGAASDVQPSYSKDGGTIYFASDRGPYGVFNIHAMDVATGDLVQYTDVVGGCFAPVEMAQRDGETQVAFTAYNEGTFRLFKMPLKQPESRVEASERMAEPIEVSPFEPPLTLRVDESAKAPYKLKWDIEAPVLAVGVTDDGTFLSNAAVQFSDLLGDHRVQILASSVSDFATFNVVYANFKRRFDWGAELFDYRDYFLRATSSSFVDRDQTYRFTGVNAFLRYPISRYYSVETAVGVADTAQDLLVEEPEGSGSLVFQNFQDRFARLRLDLTGDTTRHQSFGPFQGKRFSVSTVYAPHLSGDRDGNIQEHRIDFRAYRQATRRSLFAVRIAGVQNTGDREIIYGFGGLNQLRGFEFREFIGSNLAWANFEFRYPLVDELRFPVLSLGNIRGLFFFDVGAAWLQDDRWYDPATGDLRVDSDGNPIVPFRFWDSDENRLQDARASYGMGFQFLFIGGLQFNWVWSRRLDYTQFLCDSLTCVATEGDTKGTRTDFYITYDF